MAKVSILIVTYQSDATIACCLQALEAQRFRDFEVVIVNNGDTATLETAVRTLTRPYKIVQAGKNLGSAAGNNLAAHHASKECEWLATLNPDAYPKPEWLMQFDRATQKFPKCAMFGSLQFLADRPEICDSFGDSYHAFGFAWRDHHGWLPPDNIHDHEQFAPTGTAAFYKASLFQRLNGFDDRFFCYYEDVDFAFRARLLGEYCVQLTDAQVLHEAGYANQARAVTYYTLRNMIWTFWKNMPQPLLAFLAVPHMLIVIVMIGRATLRGHASEAVQAVRDAARQMSNTIYQRRVVQKARITSPWDVATAFVWSLLAPLKHAARKKLIVTTKRS